MCLILQFLNEMIVQQCEQILFSRVFIVTEKSRITTEMLETTERIYVFLDSYVNNLLWKSFHIPLISSGFTSIPNNNKKEILIVNPLFYINIDYLHV